MHYPATKKKNLLPKKKKKKRKKAKEKRYYMSSNVNLWYKRTKKDKINQRDIPIIPIFYALQDDVILKEYQQKSLSVYGNNNISQDTLNRPIKRNDTGILLISNPDDLALLLTNLRNDIYCSNRDNLRIYRRSLYPRKKNFLLLYETCLY